MPLTTEVKQLITTIKTKVKLAEDLPGCERERDRLNKKIKSSSNIVELKQALQMISEELAKITFDVPIALAVWGTAGVGLGCLAKFSLFATVGTGITGALVGGCITHAAEEMQIGEEGSTKKEAFFLLRMLRNSLNRRITFLSKQQETTATAEQKDSGLRHRH